MFHITFLSLNIYEYLKITSIYKIIINKKTVHSSSFMLSSAKSFEILPKHDDHGFISEPFLKIDTFLVHWQIEKTKCKSSFLIL